MATSFENATPCTRAQVGGDHLCSRPLIEPVPPALAKAAAKQGSFLTNPDWNEIAYWPSNGARCSVRAINAALGRKRSLISQLVENNLLKSYRQFVVKCEKTTETDKKKARRKLRMPGDSRCVGDCRKLAEDYGEARRRSAGCTGMYVDPWSGKGIDPWYLGSGSPATAMKMTGEIPGIHCDKEGAILDFRDGGVEAAIAAARQWKSPSLTPGKIALILGAVGVGYLAVNWWVRR